MYKNFYRLNRNPFDLTPDPTCFVPTARHNEALAALYYGVRRHKGVVVVTGEVGTGKTLLLRCLLQLFKQSHEIAYAYLFNCRLSTMEFLEYVAADFGLQSSGLNKSKLLLELSAFVTSRGLKGMTIVLIIDEAHNLSAELLEEIRLLSNLETNQDKLLQIVLVGQPELDEKLDSFALRPLKQRIALRAQLSSLDFAETKEYISKRLAIAGDIQQSTSLFAPEALALIHQFSRGYPRLINTICENALITGYARQMPTVSGDIIRQVAEDFRLDLKIGTAEGKGTGQNDLSNENAKDLFLDLCSTSKRPPHDGVQERRPIPIKVGAHESDI
jgi:general secretion pathway protein A